VEEWDSLLSSTRAFSPSALLPASIPRLGKQRFRMPRNLAPQSGKKVSFSYGHSISCGITLGGPSSHSHFALDCLGSSRERDEPFERASGGGRRWRAEGYSYPLQLPATFSWDGGQGIVRHGEGCTRNISERGVFVDAAICPPIGSSIELAYSLPALPGSSRPHARSSHGRNLRLEAAEPGEHSVVLQSRVARPFGATRTAATLAQRERTRLGRCALQFSADGLPATRFLDGGARKL